MMSPQATASFDLVGVPLIFGGVLSLLGLIFFTIGALRTMMCKNWVHSTGLIVNKDGGTEGWPSRYPTFGWTGPDGRIHRKTSMVHGGFYRPGRQVPILVDPAQPDRAIIDTNKAYLRRVYAGWPTRNTSGGPGVAKSVSCLRS